MATSTILQTKLHIPQLRTSLVSRPRLIERLNAGLNGKLTLIAAPAGYGKTTLVTEWLSGKYEGERPVLPRGSASRSEVEGMRDEKFPPSSFIPHPFRVAWLSLDEGDNDPRRFLDYLLAALRQVEAEIGQAVEAMLQSPQPPPSDVILTALVNEIAAVTQPFILVLDDYHVIHIPPIHGQLNFLLDHKPLQMCMVIITREDPPLPLPRLRVRGQLTEIRQTDLRFSPEECADFLQRVMGLDLSSEDVAALERRTEGWIAGLQLAALSMRGHEDVSGFIQAFTGSSRFILDYLMDEVFERQSPNVKDFLLKTSILERLCGTLCDSVISDQLSVIGSQFTGSQAILEYLEHSNLFIIPLDQSRQWYRYHRLFADLLRQRLQATETISQSTLHLSASQWFANEGLFPEAIHHALEGADWDRAADLVAGQSEVLFGRGELMTLLGWLKPLPNAAIFARPQLCLDYGWALTLTGQLDAASVYLNHAEESALGDNILLGTILVAQAYNLRLRGNYHQAIEHARRAQTLLSPEDHRSQGMVLLTLGFALGNCGRLNEAERAFIAVDEPARQSNNHYARVTALAYLGMIQGVYGRLHRAAELCQEAIQMAGQLPTVAPAHIELGVLSYEWNDLKTAARHLQMGIEQSERIGNWLTQCDGYRNLALLQLTSGELAAAESTLQKAHELDRSHDVNPITRMRNVACQVQIALAKHDLTAAQFWAEQVTEPADASLLYPYLELTPVRILLAQEKTIAIEKLRELYEIASKNCFGAGMVEVRALQALAANTPEEALHFLRVALEAAQPEGYIRTFVNKGEPMKFLLRRLKAEGGELREYILTLLSAFGVATRDSQYMPFIEPMSERELEILRLLAEGLSNREIAEKLVITVGTTKSHVHHILEKLGTGSRILAAAKARELGLL